LRAEHIPIVEKYRAPECRGADFHVLVALPQGEVLARRSSLRRRSAISVEGQSEVAPVVVVAKRVLGRAK
jgi:hypothetical protein